MNCPTSPIESDLVQVNAYSSDVPCGDKTLVNALITDASGNRVADGTPVKFLGTGGSTVDPTDGTTVNGTVTTTFTAPAAPGNVDVVVSVGDLFGKARITVDCETPTPGAEGAASGTPGASGTAAAGGSSAAGGTGGAGGAGGAAGSGTAVAGEGGAGGTGGTGGSSAAGGTRAPRSRRRTPATRAWRRPTARRRRTASS